MKCLSGYDKIFETEIEYFSGNMKVILGHLDRALKAYTVWQDPADKTFLGMCIVSNVSKWSNLLLKMRLKLLSLAPVLNGNRPQKQNHSFFNKNRKVIFDESLINYQKVSTNALKNQHQTQTHQ